MKNVVLFFSIVIFAIFIGAQITEGALLVPFWKSLRTSEFYAYYNEFGPSIGKFYTILTIAAALIPIGMSIYCKLTNSKALRPALISSFFALLFVSSFYIYFKGANQLFYDGALNEIDLQKELVTWTYWHWGRIFVECLSLVFLTLSIIQIQNTTSK